MTMNHLPGGANMTDMMPATASLQRKRLCRRRLWPGGRRHRDLAAHRPPGTVGEYSWGGAASTYFFADPKEELAVVFMTQVLARPTASGCAATCAAWSMAR